MTDAGGQFYNMQQVLSETLLGRYNKLKDAWEIMLAEFASGEILSESSLKRLLMVRPHWFSLYIPWQCLLAQSLPDTHSRRWQQATPLPVSFRTRQTWHLTFKQGAARSGVNTDRARILATKNQITGADLRALANARALTTEKLNQLRLSGKITAEQYNTYRGIVLRQTGEKTVRMEMMRTLVAMRSMSVSSMFSSLKDSGLALRHQPWLHSES